jgi:hypothetical protein
MSIDFLILNPHLAPFFILFFVGACFLLVAPLLYMNKYRKIIITPSDFLKYSGFVKILLVLGAIFVFSGIIGAAIISETYGYKTIVTDIHGNKRIENIK